MLNPMVILMTAAASTIITSRLIATAVSQNGIGSVKVNRGIERMTKAVTSSSLSAIGSRIAPSCVFWLKLRATSPSSPSVMAATKKTPSAQVNRW